MAGLAQPTVWGSCAPQAGSVDQSVHGGALSVRDCGPLSFPHVRFAAPCSPEAHQEHCHHQALSPDCVILLRDCGRSSHDHADHHEELWEGSIARNSTFIRSRAVCETQMAVESRRHKPKTERKLRIMLPNEKMQTRKNSKRCSYLYNGHRDPLPIGLL